MSNNSSLSSKNKFQRFLAICLASTTLSQAMILPAFAEGTAAGTEIINEATATYEDNDGNPLDTTSNRVTVTVAEVAGITNTPQGINDEDGGSVEAGDVLTFDFLITNTGNATTDIFVPSADQITTTGLEAIADTNVEVSTDGGTTFNDITTLTDNLVEDISANGSFIVRVTGTVLSTNNLGDPVGVTLGNTGANDNSLATQNQPDDADGINDDEVRTVNIDTTDDPVNGEREASATQDVAFATEIQPLALATITKVASNVDPGGSDSGSDDIITYDLGLTVENSSPDGTFEPAPLEGTPINLEGSGSGNDIDGNGTNEEDRVLVSDVIPEGTVLNGEPDPNNLPTGWTVVYSYDDPETTVPVASGDAGALDGANWTTTAPDTDPNTDTTTDLEDVERIGFIYDATTDGDELPANGIQLTGFQFSVITSGLPGAGGTVYNIAQVFGQTFDDPNDNIDVDDEIVYDESGDQRPNNFNDDGTPPDDTGSLFDPGDDTGVADPDQDGIDENGNNTGTGPDGEDNEVVVTGTVEADDDILNGPLDTPEAVGPNNDNDDFTNVSTDPNGDADGDPSAVTIQNTVSVPATGASEADNVTIEPIVPTGATSAESASDTGGSGFFGANNEIPTNTTVIIRFDVDGDGNAETATYSYDGNAFTTGDTPINVGTVNPGDELTYEVEVDFPAGTGQVQGYNIPIIAFPDDDPTSNAGYTGETVNNITIDRVYTGFITLVKEARILDADGNVREAFTQTPNVDVQPGDFIEYRIRYENISEAPIGTGNVTLNANNFTITEDGTVADTDANRQADQDGNNWALDGEESDIGGDGIVAAPDGEVDTLHSQNTSASTGTVTFSNLSGTIGTTDPADGTDVTQYENEVGTVEPGDTGTFIFRREVQ
ncbi:MAG: hypothetical protein GVY04_16335 [Cyanobacteria bacterium]|jgi:hypothetical protein|nr:hypothetical protein [Cyanobacteria bacterium GSL.Bin1]